MKNSGLRFWVIVANVMLVGALAFCALAYLNKRDAPQEDEVSVRVDGVNSAVSDNIVETLAFSGYLEKGGTRFAILQNQIVSVGETVTVKVAHTNYRLLVAGLDADQVRLNFIERN